MILKTIKVNTSTNARLRGSWLFAVFSNNQADPALKSNHAKIINRNTNHNPSRIVGIHLPSVTRLADQINTGAKAAID